MSEKSVYRTICQIDFKLCSNPAGSGNCGKDENPNQLGCPIARAYLLKIAETFIIDNPGPLKLVGTGDTVLSLRKQGHGKNIIRLKSGIVENNLNQFSNPSSPKQP